ncbi:hypothetical protein [Microbacterium dextranolyticum]|uniref:DUF3168 domain-containing protein n=1 Tax=Microbacterium dextranolyticum TaxID=36806 RepID=A0A9W6HNH3_9MICO|nr:hypothetical protein [Microbacterium dextranolyticum]MBM7462914.1 hypothetical protein [Microbacterium dextranolyticum]GLJ95981.1 hypothetical protein GCM10017591_20440 [Microbacterium dextranolyticum]
MSWLTAERQEVADLLTAAGITGTISVPSAPRGTVAMVLPGDPYLGPGELFGERALRLDIWIIAGQGDNAALSDSLDDLIATAVTALESDEIAVESVAQPITWAPASGSSFLVTIISARVLVRPPAPTS